MLSCLGSRAGVIINLKILPIFWYQPKRIPKMYYESLNNTTMRDSMYPIPKVYINPSFFTYTYSTGKQRYSIGKQRSPFGFQSHPKYSRNKHSFPKNVITAKFGSMRHKLRSHLLSFTSLSHPKLKLTYIFYAFVGMLSLRDSLLVCPAIEGSWRRYDGEQKIEI